MNEKKEQFNLEIAIEDKGICERQKVLCSECEMGVLLGYNDKEQLCLFSEVYEQAQKIIDEPKLKWLFYRE